MAFILVFWNICLCLRASWFLFGRCSCVCAVLVLDVAAFAALVFGTVVESVAGFWRCWLASWLLCLRSCFGLGLRLVSICCLGRPLVVGLALVLACGGVGRVCVSVCG